MIWLARLVLARLARLWRLDRMAVCAGAGLDGVWLADAAACEPMHFHGTAFGAWATDAPTDSDEPARVLPALSTYGVLLRGRRVATATSDARRRWSAGELTRVLGALVVMGVRLYPNPHAARGDADAHARTAGAATRATGPP